MLELFTTFKIIESYSNINEGLETDYFQTKIPTSWIIFAILIALGTAYIAYACNEYETPATRALATLIAFFFSGFYLIYYFIVHVLFDRPCSSRSITNIVKNFSKK
jgi:uncharacterized protein YybS (DUF2232 family)